VFAMAEIYMDVRIIERNTGELLDLPHLLNYIKQRITEKKFCCEIDYNNVEIKWYNVAQKKTLGMSNSNNLSNKIIKKHTKILLSHIENTTNIGGVDWTIVSVLYSASGCF
jgi:hypothetical protein